LRRIAPAHGAGDVEPVVPIEEHGRLRYGTHAGRVLSIDAAGRVTTVVDFGPGGVHSVVPLGGGRFAAANVDGRLAVFEIR